MKKIISGLLVLCALLFVGCGGNGTDPSGLGEISVLTREEGSGTRSAFVELFELETTDENGNKIDMTTQEAMTTNNTAVMMTSVNKNKNAIGYISMGSLDDSVKGLKIDGVEPTTANVQNGRYKFSRPFNIVTTSQQSELAKEFVRFILSDSGQQIIENNGYISVATDPQPFSTAKPTGKIIIVGSSSVAPVMEKLKEAYLMLNDEAQIDLTQSDSSNGIASVADGICDIGMASRPLKESEMQKGLTPTAIALDGVAVIVNNDNPFDGLKSKQIQQIFMGEITTWEAL